MIIKEIAAQLEHTGYIILDNPLLDKLLAQLFVRCHDNDQTRFHAAHIGRGTDKTQMSSVRGDVINWLDETDHTDQAYLVWMNKLRIGLNAILYLGLFDFECHYAIYGAGLGYAKHLDVFNGSRNRILSTVLYLNDDWHPGDGGELVLYEPAGLDVLATVIPKYGTMILFLSESFPHEVLISNHRRRSIAGWFRVSGSHLPLMRAVPS